MVRPIVLVSAVLLIACSGEPDHSGELGQACTAAKSCKAGLICLLDLCVREVDAGWRDLYHSPHDLRHWVDGPAASDGPLTKQDAPATKQDGPKPKPDIKPWPDLYSPTACVPWSAWSCIGNAKPGVACWSTCGAVALWCTHTGSCTCTGSSSGTPCATALAVDLGNPCETCKVAHEQKGCCAP